MNSTVTDHDIPITRARIAATERAIRPHVRRTPLLAADAAEFGLAPGPLLFKLELLQHSGSFKARGAFANLLLRRVPDVGVVAAGLGRAKRVKGWTMYRRDEERIAAARRAIQERI